MYATLEETPALAAARRLVGEADADAPPGAAGLYALVAQVCAEAGLWAPDAAERALGQAQGDPARAVALVRVWAASLPQIAASVVAPDDVTITRRLSAAYPEVPGGQWLGAAPELASRLLAWPPEPDGSARRPVAPAAGVDGEAATVNGTAAAPPTRATCPRVRDLIADVPILPAPDDGDGADPASAALAAPLDRATRLGVMARGDTAGLVALAALVLGRRREAILAELVSGVVTVRIPHPRSGVPCAVAEVPVVEADAIVDADVQGRPGFAVGWGASLGIVERRAIAIGLLDGALQADSGAPDSAIGLDADSVLSAIDGSATNGFVDHLRLPHYASFAAYLANAGASAGDADDDDHDDADSHR